MPSEYEKNFLESLKDFLCLTIRRYKPQMGHMFTSRSVIGNLNGVIIIGLDQIDYISELPWVMVGRGVIAE